MTTQRKTILAVALVALAFAGCHTTRDTTTSPPQEVDASRMLTPLQTTFSYVTPRDVKQRGGLRLALIDVDFTKTNLAYNFSIVDFTPDGTDTVLARAVEPARRLSTLAELRDHLLPYVPDGRVGVIILHDGEPLGVGGKTPTSEQIAFFRAFAAMMDEAEIVYSYIVPAKVVVIR